MNDTSQPVYEFGDFRFESSSHRLYRAGEPVIIPRKATELLLLLLQNVGTYVPKEKIFESIWRNAFVEDGVLTQNVYLLRKALGKKPDGTHIIENRSRFGYRIDVDISVVEPTPWAVALEPEIAEPEQKRKAPVAAAKSGLRWLIPTLSAFVILVGLVAGVIYLPGALRKLQRSSVRKVKFTQITNTGDVLDAAISPNGDFVAIVRGDGLYLRQTETSGELKIAVPDVDAFGAVQFSGDGTMLYFRPTRQPHAIAPVLRCSRFGGAPEVIAEKSYSTFAVSPDDRFVAYYSAGQTMSLKLMIRNLQSGEEREIFDSGGGASVTLPIAPAWSPDGRTILHVAQVNGPQPSRVVMIDVDTAKQTPISIDGAFRVEQPAWHSDGRSIFVSASENGRHFNLWRIAVPSGEVERLTIGLESYLGTSLAEGGRKILALRSTETANLFVANVGALDAAHAVTTGNSNEFGRNSLAWLGEQLVFSAQREDEHVENLWSITLNGSARRQLTFEAESTPFGAAVNGSRIFFHVSRGDVANIYTTDASGQKAVAVTDSPEGSRRLPQITSDGKWLYYLFRSKAQSGIMRRDMESGAEEMFFQSETVRCGFFLTLSPDGKLLACPNWKNSEGGDATATSIALISTEDPTKVNFLTIAGSTPFRFSPDSMSIDFISRENGKWKLVRQPLDASSKQPLTAETQEAINNFAWAADGRRLAISRGPQSRDVVILDDFE